MTWGALVETPAPRAAAPAKALDRKAHTARRRDTWPLPALATWAGAWAVFLAARAVGTSDTVALIAAIGCGAAASAAGSTRWRRIFLAAGFPLSYAVAGGALPGWAWLAALAGLGLAYPLNAWRDAPFFPTPTDALDGLAGTVPLAAGASVLDAGCGLGHGLAALRRAYPAAALEGVEWSWPLAWLARGRAARLGARVRRGDMWAGRWQDHAMVYLFQRPETLPRAVSKARAELVPGAWLASLEFEACELQPDAVWTCPDGRPLWLYRMPFVSAGAVRGPKAGYRAGRKGR